MIAMLSKSGLVLLRRFVLCWGPCHPLSLDYNLACVAALRNERAAALLSLRRAVDAGWTFAWIATDPDLESLHGDPEFEAIVEEVRSRLREE